MLSEFAKVSSASELTIPEKPGEIFSVFFFCYIL